MDAPCSICLDPLEGRTIVTTICKHTFHVTCYQKWHEQKTCPICRAPLERIVVEIPETTILNTMSRGKRCCLVVTIFTYLAFAYATGIVIGYYLSD